MEKAKKKVLIIHPGNKLDFSWKDKMPSSADWECVHTNKGQFNEGNIVDNIDLVVIDATEGAQHVAIWSVIKTMLEHYLKKAKVNVRWFDNTK